MRVRDLLTTTAPAATVLVRVIVGWVFLSEGILKFRLPETLGVGRFTQIGIPAPEAMAPFVGVVEIVCGGLLIVGFLPGWPPCRYGSTSPWQSSRRNCPSCWATATGDSRCPKCRAMDFGA